MLNGVSKRGPVHPRTESPRAGSWLEMKYTDPVPDTWYQSHQTRDLYFDKLAGGPVVKTLCLHCSGCGFDPWLGN